MPLEFRLLFHYTFLVGNAESLIFQNEYEQSVVPRTDSLLLGDSSDELDG